MNLQEQENLQKTIDRIKILIQTKPYVIIAIDGRSAAGKTTLANRLAEYLDCNIIHMDHFFLRSEQRTRERLNEIGGNIDYERFLDEVLHPLKDNRTFSYRPFDCQKQCLGNPIYIEKRPLTIIEGSYSCHPRLRDNYDLHIFLTISAEEQMQRIIKRDGTEAAARFRDLWIPLEEAYFAKYPLGALPRDPARGGKSPS